MITRDIIRVLYADQNESDRKLVRSSLEASCEAFAITEAVSRQEFESRLGDCDFDVVVADLALFDMDGSMALASVKSKQPGIPVVIVTSTGSEEIAAETVKKGAADYVLKSSTFGNRLPEAIRSAVEKRPHEEDHRRSLLALKESQTQLMGVISSAMDAIITVDADQRIVRTIQRRRRTSFSTSRQRGYLS